MAAPNSSLTRALDMLDAFTPARYAWTIEDLASRFDYTASSTYRYVRELCHAGLLVRMPRGRYVVGPRVVELEALIRDTDPLSREAKSVLRQLAEETGCHALVSNAYGTHLINVIHEPGLEALNLTYLRGRSLPWFRGAPGRAVLAFWPRARVRKLFDATFADQEMGARWNEVRADLRQIRKAGYCVSKGQLDAQTVGFGAPVRLEEEVIGSLSLVCSRQRADLLNESTIGKLLIARAAELSRRVLAFGDAAVA